MKEKILKIAQIVLWSLLFAGAVFLLGFTNYEHQDSVCRNLYIRIDYGQADVLVTTADIDSLILKTNGRIKGKSLWQINTEKIEKPVRSQPYVESASVYMTYNGDVIVDVIQRKPILRIITNGYQSLYIDGKGEFLPLNPNNPARVIVATGFISDSLLRKAPHNIESLLNDSSGNAGNLASLYRLALFLAGDPFFRAQIEQIYVRQDGDIELIPKVGDQVILLGNTNDLDDKFRRLYVFYRLGLNETGWNKYNLINIKFKNQVVCSKR
jgi:cell division protein FtsQ